MASSREFGTETCYFLRQPEFNTIQLHGGQAPDTATNARAVPIYASTSFVFNDSAVSVTYLFRRVIYVDTPESMAQIFLDYGMLSNSKTPFDQAVTLSHTYLGLKVTSTLVSVTLQSYVLSLLHSCARKLTISLQAVFEERIAALEGGVAAVAVSSGLAAQFLAISAIADAGDNIVST